MMKMFGFWRSAASFRVRMALRYKGLPFDEEMIDLDAGEQRQPRYLALNPQGAVPLLITEDGAQLVQSLAILEFLEETHPTPALLPPDPAGRLRVRGLALLWAADHHPLIVPRIRTFLRDALGTDEAGRTAWVQHWFREGLRIGEARLAANADAGRFCHRDTLSIADLCLMSHAMGAQGFGVDTAPFPRSMGIVDRCLEVEAVAQSVPLRQPGAPAA